MASHAVKKASWSALVGEDSQCIFIRGATGLEHESSVSVFGSPV